MDQAKLFTVDQFPFLAFFDPFDRQPHLFFELIIRTIIKVRDSSMNADDGLDCRQGVLARILGVIDKCLGDFDVLGKSRDEVDIPFTEPIDRGSHFQM